MARGRLYVATYKIAALAAAKTLMYVTTGSNRPVFIRRAMVTNESNSTNQQLSCAIDRVSDGTGAAGTAVTPVLVMLGDAAVGFTVLGNLSVEPATYSDRLDVQGFPSLSGYRFEPDWDGAPYIAPSAKVGLRLLTTPTAFDCEVEMVIEEVGSA